MQEALKVDNRRFYLYFIPHFSCWGLNTFTLNVLVGLYIFLLIKFILISYSHCEAKIYSLIKWWNDNILLMASLTLEWTKKTLLFPLKSLVIEKKILNHYARFQKMYQVLILMWSFLYMIQYYKNLTLMASYMKCISKIFSI